MLRLPTGIFYAQGVKANVLFFDKKPAVRAAVDAASCGSTTCAPTSTSRSSRTRCAAQHLDDFVDVLPARQGPRVSASSPSAGSRSRYDELIARDKVNLDITWLRDDSLEDLDNLPAPEIIAREIVEDLTAALAEFEAVAAALEAGSQPKHSA